MDVIKKVYVLCWSVGMPRDRRTSIESIVQEREVVKELRGMYRIKRIKDEFDNPDGEKTRLINKDRCYNSVKDALTEWAKMNIRTAERLQKELEEVRAEIAEYNSRYGMVV